MTRRFGYGLISTKGLEDAPPSTELVLLTLAQESKRQGWRVGDRDGFIPDLEIVAHSVACRMNLERCADDKARVEDALLFLMDQPSRHGIPATPHGVLERDAAAGGWWIANWDKFEAA